MLFGQKRSLHYVTSKMAVAWKEKTPWISWTRFMVQVQTQHQNREERWFKWRWMSGGCRHLIESMPLWIEAGLKANIGAHCVQLEVKYRTIYQPKAEGSTRDRRNPERSLIKRTFCGFNTELFLIMKVIKSSTETAEGEVNYTSDVFKTHKQSQPRNMHVWEKAHDLVNL